MFPLKLEEALKSGLIECPGVEGSAHCAPRLALVGAI